MRLASFALTHSTYVCPPQLSLFLLSLTLFYLFVWINTSAVDLMKAQLGKNPKATEIKHATFVKYLDDNQVYMKLACDRAIDIDKKPPASFSRDPKSLGTWLDRTEKSYLAMDGPTGAKQLERLFFCVWLPRCSFVSVHLKLCVFASGFLFYAQVPTNFRPSWMFSINTKTWWTSFGKKKRKI